MSSDYDRATVDPSDDRGRFKKTLDTLQETFTQTVETVTRQARFEVSGGGVDTVDAPDNLDELVDEAKKVGFVWRAFDIFANEVWEPGYRLEGPDETLAYFLGETDEVDANPPEGTPEGGFLENCGVHAGVKRSSFYEIGRQASFQRRLRGTVLVEMLKQNPDDPESIITGFNFVRPETVSAETYPYSNILIDPEDTDLAGVDITRRGEAAAYIQWEDSSILGRARENGLENDEIPLSQNDLKKQVLNPGIGDDASEEQGIFGTSEIEPISEDITEYRQIKRDRATAIQNKAHGVFFIEHGRDVLDYGNGEVEIIEWDNDSMDNFENELSSLEPGGYVTHDASIEVDRKEGDVPDLVDTIDQIINDIFAGLPVPKYKVGFSDDINRDVTSEQSNDSERLVQEEREYQERWWTDVFKFVADRKGLPTDGLKLRIEPEPEDSPVLSMSSEEIEKLSSYATALDTLAGPQAGPQTLVDTETLLTDVAQLPDSVNDVEDINPEDSEDPDTLSEFMGIMEMDTYQNAGEGDVVELPSGGKGVVVMEGGDDVEIDGESVEEGEVVVAYASQQGYTIVDADELESASFDVPEDADPEDIQETMAGDAYEGLENPDSPEAIDVLVGTGIGFDSWPDSWEDADTPARIIALDAWSSMGGTWRGCFREIGSQRICSAFKDEILGTTQWR